MIIEQGFQVPFAEEIRTKADIATMAVGFLWDAQICEDLIATGKADMVALAREFLEKPNWTLQAAAELGSNENYNAWPIESGWWLMKRDRLLSKLDLKYFRGKTLLLIAEPD